MSSSVVSRCRGTKNDVGGFADVTQPIYGPFFEPRKVLACKSWEVVAKADDDFIIMRLSTVRPHEAHVTQV